MSDKNTGTDPSPSQIVQEFLSAMERRELSKASEYLADGFIMTFPGGVMFDQLVDLIEWSKERYQKIGKSYQQFDESEDANGATVYCFGTLYGEWLDGSEFEGIRFIDRFTIRSGKLTDQKVWNDMAEMKVMLSANRQ